MIRLLTVCTGNICRSPYAERMLQKEFDALHPGLFQVASAGTASMAGDGMEAESAQLLAALGGSSEGFISRQLTPQILAGSELVLAMTVAHRDAVIRLSPRMLKRAYTLIEFARILRTLKSDAGAQVPLGGSPGQVEARWAAMPGLAATFRSSSRPSAAGDDVVDPYLRSSTTHQRMVEEIMPAVEEIVAFEAWCSGS
ncbi:low molecular weight phosphatase family protein [Arthrobacter sp. A2-55]|uniref:arsenate reductase/protein-tyrosine-phosphatase family protein n=1 Tax=Arthrobacter sp. A2-55 TaxID=2897337 RepID=UPI0021CDD706|nr:low molecular weight phosphatase family protein [Arthrobacter sp. A2-55]MCU6481511.1 low molecular weight phosphatase family protein [Arthrobacter sp. A2-55]